MGMYCTPLMMNAPLLPLDHAAKGSVESTHKVPTGPATTTRNTATFVQSLQSVRFISRSPAPRSPLQTVSLSQSVISVFTVPPLKRKHVRDSVNWRFIGRSLVMTKVVASALDGSVKRSLIQSTQLDR